MKVSNNSQNIHPFIRQAAKDLKEFLVNVNVNDVSSKAFSGEEIFKSLARITRVLSNDDLQFTQNTLSALSERKSLEQIETESPGTIEKLIKIAEELISKDDSLEPKQPAYADIYEALDFLKSDSKDKELRDKFANLITEQLNKGKITHDDIVDYIGYKEIEEIKELQEMFREKKLLLKEPSPLDAEVKSSTYFSRLRHAIEQKDPSALEPFIQDFSKVKEKREISPDQE